MGVMTQTLDTLTDQAIVRDCGFCSLELEDDSFDMASDNRYAAKMGQLALELVGRRCMRLLYVLLGLPHHLFIMLVCTRKGKLAVELFRGIGKCSMKLRCFCRCGRGG